MKLFKGVLLAAAATLALSTTAFAAEATYDSETNKVALELAAGDVNVTGGQMTVVVVPKTFGVDEALAEVIYYINQDEFGDAFTAIIANMGLKGSLDNPAEYEVRIGGEQLSAPVVFDIKSDGTGEVTVIYGDVDGTATPDSTDASYVMQYFAEIITEFPHPDGNEVALKAADVDGTGVVDSTDASYIMQYFAEIITQFPIEQQ